MSVEPRKWLSSLPAIFHCFRALVPRRKPEPSILPNVDNSVTIYLASAVLQGKHLPSSPSSPPNNLYERLSTMSTISGKSAQKHWIDLVKSNLAVAMTVSSFIFVAVRFLIISHGHLQTATFLLAHSDKIPLLVGIFFPVLPFWFSFLFFVILRTIFIFRYPAAGFSGRFLVFLLIVVGAISFNIGNKWTWLLAAIMAYLLLDAKVPWWLRSKKTRDAHIFEPRANKKIFYRDDIAWSPEVIIAMAIIGIYVSSDVSWLPTECVTFKDQSVVTASVLSIDPNFTYYVKSPDNAPGVVFSTQIEKREIASNDKNAGCQKAKEVSKAPSTPKVPSGLMERK